MGNLAGFKYREVCKKLKRFDFEFLRQAKGSHEIWWNKQKNLYTTLVNCRGDIPEGTLRAIIKQAEITPEEFLK